MLIGLLRFGGEALTLARQPRLFHVNRSNGLTIRSTWIEPPTSRDLQNTIINSQTF